MKKFCRATPIGAAASGWHRAMKTIFTFGRFFFENLRIDPAHEVRGLRINAWVSIGVFLAALAWFLWLGQQASQQRRPGDSPGHFGRPKGVAVDQAGHIYVADALFDNIQVFDISGRLLMVWGETGAEAGEFWLPEGIAVNQMNEILIADSYNQRVQVFKYLEAP